MLNEEDPGCWKTRKKGVVIVMGKGRPNVAIQASGLGAMTVPIPEDDSREGTWRQGREQTTKTTTKKLKRKLAG